MKCLPFVLLFILSTSFSQSYGIDNPKVRWKFKTQGPIRSGGALHNDKIFFGSADGSLYAVNKLDGSLTWKFQTQGALTGSPTIDGSSVYVASRDNYLYAINITSGSLNWKYKTEPILPDETAGWEYFSAAPLVSQDMVFIGSGDGYLYALDKGKGKLEWKFRTQGRIRATPLIKDGVIYQPSNDGYVYALDVQSGSLLWKFETRGATYDPQQFGFDRNSINTQAIIKDNLLVFGSRDGNVYAVNLDSHLEKWSFTYGTTWAMATTVSDNSVYVGWSTNNLICAIDLSTGKEIWKYQAGAHNYAKPLILDSGLYVGSADGNMYRFDKYTGEKIWEYAIGSEIFSPAFEDSGILYFGSDDGCFYALEEGENAYKAVYQPLTIRGNARFLVVDPKLTPYLCERGFERLDSAGLFTFLNDRINDGNPSVVVFSLPLIPSNMVGDVPGEGMIRKYLESGGKIVWMGDIPNFYEPDQSGNFKRDASVGSQLLEVDFNSPRESGNYYSKVTQEGLDWGLPPWITTTNSTVSPDDEIIPFAYDEYGRISLWKKSFHTRPGSGFVSIRTWGWNVPIKDKDLEFIYSMAIYGLQ